ncbi:MAG: metallophosphoesterase family protein [Planctomycetota bacterium]
MRLALLADIHGNAVAFDAVLADLGKHEVDGCVLMGDYFLFGPRPREVYERLRDLDWPAIEGNTDRYIVGANAEHPFAEMIGWYRKQLGEDGLAWASDRPFSREDGTLLVVHANPTNLEDLLIGEQDVWESYQLTTAEEGARLMEGVEADLTVYGHIHYFSSGEFGGRQVASIGSIGMPFDGDPRAAYAIAGWDGSHWSIEPHRVAYDQESVAAEVRAQGTQLAEPRARRFLEARPVPLR